MINSISQSSTYLQSVSSTSAKARQEEMFAKMDTNGDGSIDKTEFAAFAPPQQAGASQQMPSVDEMFAQIDSDGDGSITKSEMEALEKSHPRPPKGPDSGELFSKIDGDSNGSITKAEFEAFLEQMKQEQNSSSSSTYTQAGTTGSVLTDSSVNLIG
jgi:Ca2+-binding EF-hand superfamily protein